jgi:hypothetical protein
MAKIEKIIVENTNNIKDNNEQIKKLQNNVGDEFMVKLSLFRERCMQLKKKQKICIVFKILLIGCLDSKNF